MSLIGDATMVRSTHARVSRRAGALSFDAASGRWIGRVGPWYPEAWLVEVELHAEPEHDRVAAEIHRVDLRAHALRLEEYVAAPVWALPRRAPGHGAM